MNSTHPSLLQRCRNPADRAAWDDFDARYGKLVVNYCLSRGIQLSDAEDVRQIVMLQLAVSLPGFQYDATRGRFRDYLGKTARNAIARHFSRHVGAEVGLPENGADAAGPDEFATLWECEWVQHHCRQALLTLRHEDHGTEMLVFDRLLAGESIEQVAAALTMTPTAVRKAKQRVKDRLRAIVAGQVRDEERRG